MTITKTAEFTVFDVNGNKTDSAKTLELRVSGTNANYLVHKALMYQNHDEAQKSGSSKTRGEVRGDGRKPWKQKGTGRARAGSNRSPLWKGGGVIFGPKPIKRDKKINKKEWDLAIRTLLYNRSSSLYVIQDFEDIVSTLKTNLFSKFLNAETQYLVNGMLNINDSIKNFAAFANF